MSFRNLSLLAAVLAPAAAAACATSPAAPAGVTTVTTPGLVAPADGARIPHGSQPVTVTVNNAFVGSGADPVVYAFEIATDASFAGSVQTKEAPQGSGQTSVKLDMLAPGRDYYWRVRTVAGGTTGAFSSPYRFSVGPAVTLGAPDALAPEPDEYTAPRAAFTVANVAHGGPAGPLTYRFEVSASASFATVLASTTVPEGDGQTTGVLTADLPAEATLFWRAQAIDQASSVQGPFSTPRSFKTTVTIDLTAVDYQRFINPSAWPETDRIIAVEQDGGAGYICINHTKRGAELIVNERAQSARFVVRDGVCNNARGTCSFRQDGVCSAVVANN
jgi:hypothetical protein